MNRFLTLPLYNIDEVNISEYIPEIYVYLPQNQASSTKAIVISGGGGFNKVNLDHEGHQFAQWLNTINIAGVVVNYRMPHGDKSIPEADLRQAVRLVRKHAEEWNINPLQIGGAGFSIGGHAITRLATKEEAGSKLNFTLLFYSVISMTDQLTHIPSRDKLLGISPAMDVLNSYSSENNVTSSTPPALIMASDDDQVVSPLNGVVYYEKLKMNNIPASLHIFSSGGHGWGMKKEFLYHREMLAIVSQWLCK